MATIRRKQSARTGEDPESDKAAAVRPDEMPADVLEFITAMDDYKRSHQRPFPNWSEVLEVLKALGYARTRSRSVGAAGAAGAMGAAPGDRSEPL